MSNLKKYVLAFRKCELSRQEWTHEGHVQVAWFYLKEQPIEQALPLFKEHLKRFNHSHDNDAGYHETITVAMMKIIDQRMKAMDQEHDWQAFAEKNADLLCWEPSVLDEIYSKDVLDSEEARRGFVSPETENRKPNSEKWKSGTELRKPNN